MNQTKKEIKEIFTGMLKKSPLTILFGYGTGSLSVYITNLEKIEEQNFSNFIPNLELNLVPFIIGFVTGFIWSNSLIKEMHNLTIKQMYYRLPIIIIWMIALLILSL
jgi:hypothetical protein